MFSHCFTGFLFCAHTHPHPHTHTHTPSAVNNWTVLPQHVIYVYIMWEQDTIFENLSNNNPISPQDTFLFVHYCPISCFCCHFVIIVIIVGKGRDVTNQNIISTLRRNWLLQLHLNQIWPEEKKKEKEKHHGLTSQYTFSFNTPAHTHARPHPNTRSGQHITSRSTE